MLSKIVQKINFFHLATKILQKVEKINNISEINNLKIDTLLHFANFKSNSEYLTNEERILRRVNFLWD